MKKLLLLMLFVLLLTSCGGKSVATVGNTKITQSEFEFYLDSIKNQMSDTELQTDEDWENKEIEGKKAIDIAKEQAMDNAVRNALYIEAAEAAGLSLTESDKQTIEATKEQLVAGYGSEKAYKEFLKSNNITDEFVEMMCKSSVYYNKIGQLVTEETTIEEDELKMLFEQGKADFEREIRKAKHILIATIDPTTNLPKSQEEQDKA
ncbi:MAG: SurA N-terminal domain-containing protein, partial [Clostridia bacterium]|nr:SurA N-terminal domain-containing protein [Clostridia bacterium]